MIFVAFISKIENKSTFQKSQDPFHCAVLCVKMKLIILT